MAASPRAGPRGPIAADARDAGLRFPGNRPPGRPGRHTGRVRHAGRGDPAARTVPGAGRRRRSCRPRRSAAARSARCWPCWPCDRDRYVSHDALAEALWPDARAGRPGRQPRRAGQPGPPRARRRRPDPYRAARVRAGRPRAGWTPRGSPTLVEQARQRPAARPAGAAPLPGRRSPAGPARRWPRRPTRAWAREFRAALLGLRQAALEEAAGLAAELGESTLAVGYAEEAVAAAPLREVAALRLSRAHEARRRPGRRAGRPAGSCGSGCATSSASTRPPR